MASKPWIAPLLGAKKQISFYVIGRSVGRVESGQKTILGDVFGDTMQRLLMMLFLTACSLGLQASAVSSSPQALNAHAAASVSRDEDRDAKTAAGEKIVAAYQRAHNRLELETYGHLFTSLTNEMQQYLVAASKVDNDASAIAAIYADARKKFNEERYRLGLRVEYEPAYCSFDVFSDKYWNAVRGQFVQLIKKLPEDTQELVRAIYVAGYLWTYRECFLGGWSDFDALPAPYRNKPPLGLHITAGIECLPVELVEIIADYAERRLDISLIAPLLPASIPEDFTISAVSSLRGLSQLPHRRVCSSLTIDRTCCISKFNPEDFLEWESLKKMRICCPVENFMDVVDSLPQLEELEIGALEHRTPLAREMCERICVSNIKRFVLVNCDFDGPMLCNTWLWHRERAQGLIIRNFPLGRLD